MVKNRSYLIHFHLNKKLDILSGHSVFVCCCFFFCFFFCVCVCVFSLLLFLRYHYLIRSVGGYFCVSHFSLPSLDLNNPCHSCPLKIISNLIRSVQWHEDPDHYFSRSNLRFCGENSQEGSQNDQTARLYNLLPQPPWRLTQQYGGSWKSHGCLSGTIIISIGQGHNYD